MLEFVYWLLIETQLYYFFLAEVIRSYFDIFRRVLLEDVTTLLSKHNVDYYLYLFILSWASNFGQT